jgi:phosphoglycerate dehydrogenase-like enzyme
MTNKGPKILLVFDKRVREVYILQSDLERLESFADWDWLELEGGENFGPNENATAIEALRNSVGDVDGIVVCHGSPMVSDEIMSNAPRLKVVGELEGDRFAYRIDVESAWKRGILTVDTTNGSSYPVSEWALALILISLRNAGAYFRRIISGDTSRPSVDDPGYVNAELTGKKVGLIGCGHIGRRLIRLLRPFDVKISVYDPYLSTEMADALGFTKTSFENVLSRPDVVVCLAPLTLRTKGMIGKRELDLIPPGRVFVNVSRGAIVDSDALIERLRQGDIIAGLDVFDPEPIPPTSEIIKLPNVFLSPHIAGVTATSRTRFFTLMVDELTRFFYGDETLFNLTPNSLANRRGQGVS